MLNFEDDPETADYLSEPGLKKNLRTATRYVRDDICVSISNTGFLGTGKSVAVKLLDISSRGALVATDEKFRINKKITLTLIFLSRKTFNIKAIIVRRSATSHHEYGIKFDRYNNELGDYLLESQSRLVFK